MKKKTMANSKSPSFLIPTIVVVLQLSCSGGEGGVKGGYWVPDGGREVSDIDPTYFTHLLCAFADLDNTTNQVTISSSNAPSFSTFTQTLQQKNPSVKTLLSIGGGQSQPKDFAAMASQASTRKAFIDSSIQVARNNNFHGLDLDWEYPSNDTEKTNLGLLLKEWRDAISEESTKSGNPALLLTAAVSGSDQISLLEYYPVQEIADNLDWVNVMTYDLFTPGGYPNLTQPPAPLENPQGQFSGDEGVTKWIKLGLPSSHIALGLPFYGYSWHLLNGEDHGLFSPSNGASSGDGTIGYADIRQFISDEAAQTVYNATFVTDYCYSGTTWIGYDDTQSVTAKINYAIHNQLLGYFAWQIGDDDHSWTLSKTVYNSLISLDASVGMNVITFEASTFTLNADAPQLSTFTQTVQQRNPSAKTLLCIGGTVSNAETLSAMARQARTRKSFIDSSMKLARSNNFHGLDLHLEPPFTASDKANYASLITEMREAVDSESRTSRKPRLLFVATVHSPHYYSSKYPVREMSKCFDWVKIFAYNFYTPNLNPTTTAPPAALYALKNSSNQISGDAVISDWIRAGLPEKKIVMGLPSHGYVWRLQNANNHGLFAPANGGNGSIGYSQITAFIRQNRASTAFDPDVVTDYCYSGTTWIGYDDVQSVSKKVAYAKKRNMRGYSFSNAAADDNGLLCQT
ncbi:Chitinase-3-like protein 2, partial [Mucuna pruriens]